MLSDVISDVIKMAELKFSLKKWRISKSEVGRNDLKLGISLSLSLSLSLWVCVSEEIDKTEN